ncbi:cytochrome P450 [Nocardia halotolerans]|uniref:Cytochrome P450 n=1 Tax=Nocardia halotolerans TaxID=1755878 RepID=A0ABV8VS43_9NOCA
MTRDSDNRMDLAGKNLGVQNGSEVPARRASVADTVAIIGKALLPTFAGGVIKRRPSVLAVAQKFQLDALSVPLFQRLRRRYGPGPLRLRIPGRSIAVVLSDADAGRLLQGSPQPFSPSTVEKRAALSHFQPHGVLISRGPVRAERREFNATTLQADRPMHEIAGDVVAVVREEAGGLVDPSGGELDWDTFNRAWWRIVRRVTLGDLARTDEEVTDLLDNLRLDANWAYLHPQRRGRRRAFDARLRSYVDRAEPGTLAKLVADTPVDDERVDAVGQIPHWLFAFDAAGMAAFRTLALLATHPAHAERARADIEGLDADQPQLMPYLRACLLDTVRLWPTTPAILRESTDETRWGTATLPAGTEFLIYTPFLHRDPETLPYADVFEPGIWLDGTARTNPALVPFSAGPAQCPGRNIVLLVVSTLLAELLRQGRYELVSAPDLDPGEPIPATIDNFGLRFRTTPI